MWGSSRDHKRDRLVNGADGCAWSVYISSRERVGRRCFLGLLLFALLAVVVVVVAHSNGGDRTLLSGRE